MNIFQKRKVWSNSRQRHDRPSKQGGHNQRSNSDHHDSLEFQVETLLLKFDLYRLLGTENKH